MQDVALVVLGPLYFLVYINGMVYNISSDAKLFADGTPLFTDQWALQ